MKVNFNKSFIVWLCCQLSRRVTRCFLYWHTFYFKLKCGLYFRCLFTSVLLFLHNFCGAYLMIKKATCQLIFWLFLFYTYTDKRWLWILFLVQFLHCDKNTDFQVTFLFRWKSCYAIWNLRSPNWRENICHCSKHN